MNPSVEYTAVSVRAFRPLIVGIATGAILLHVANILLTAWFGATTSANVRPPGFDLIAAEMQSVVAWGLGFAVLALIIDPEGDTGDGRREPDKRDNRRQHRSEDLTGQNDTRMNEREDRFFIDEVSVVIQLL